VVRLGLGFPDIHRLKAAAHSQILQRASLYADKMLYKNLKMGYWLFRRVGNGKLFWKAKGILIGKSFTKVDFLAVNAISRKKRRAAYKKGTPCSVPFSSCLIELLNHH
jgi:hypothetical protein